VKHRRVALPNRLAQANQLAGRVRSSLADYLDSVRSFPDYTALLERIEQLAALIGLWGARSNLTAAPEDPDELSFHIIDSLAPVVFSCCNAFLHHAFDAGNQVLDLGSGAGFPGLVLASATRASFTLLEGRRKRASFLAVAAAEMGLNNVVVDPRRMKPQLPSSNQFRENAQAEAPGQFDVVTARAFGAPKAFLLAAASVLKPEGIAILYANPAQNSSLLQARRNGLDEICRFPYSISRRDSIVERVLALWRPCHKPRLKIEFHGADD
jgi:16S rRNA (guanine527-N7)-methyltransferase